MQLIPRPDMSHRLGAAWAFLSGQMSDFVESIPESPRPGETQYRFVMPVISPTDRVDQLMAVGLLMDVRMASAIGSFMFGLPEEQLSSADLLDVCREACNVLGSCLVKSDDGQSVGVELGLPQQVSSDHFAELQACATVSVTFMTKLNEQRVVITVFDAVDARAMELLS